MIQHFLAERTVRGFYMPFVGALLCLAASIIYFVGYNGTGYYNLLAFLMPLIGAAVYLILAFLPWTQRFAAGVLEAFAFASFLLFIRFVYLYLSEVFYAGITPTAIASLKPQFVLVFAFELVAVILANFGIYVAPKKKLDEIIIGNGEVKTNA